MTDVARANETFTEAIPPAYTEFIGTQLLQHLSLNESKEGEANETL
jgi:hypothetical protein